MAVVNKEQLYLKTNAFPKISFQVPPKTIFNFVGLRDVDKLKVCPVVPYLDDEEEKIHFKVLSWRKKIRDNFERLLKKANSTKDNDNDIKSWALQVNFLKPKDPSKYCERTIAYIIEDNYFLVNPSFTFGIRTVEEHTMHLIQTTRVPLYIYILLRPNSKLLDKQLPTEKQRLFKEHQLNINKAYIIKEGIKYVVFSTAKTFFSIHVLPEELKLPFKTVNVMEEVEKKQDPVIEFYERPPATPHILDLKTIPRATKPNRFERFRMPPPMKRQKVYVDQSDSEPEQLEPEQPEQLEPEQPDQPEQLEPEQPEQLEPEQPEQLEPEQPEQLEQLDDVCPILEVFRYTYPLNKDIYIVEPNIIKWYNTIKWKTFDKIEAPTLIKNGYYQENPLNLTVQTLPTETAEPPPTETTGPPPTEKSPPTTTMMPPDPTSSSFQTNPYNTPTMMPPDPTSSSFQTTGPTATMMPPDPTSSSFQTTPPTTTMMPPDPTSSSFQTAPYNMPTFLLNPWTAGPSPQSVSFQSPWTAETPPDGTTQFWSESMTTELYPTFVIPEPPTDAETITDLDEWIKTLK